MLKKIILLSFLLILGVFFFKQKDDTKSKTAEVRGWDKFLKKNEKVLPSTVRKEDLKKHLIKETTRRPASKSPNLFPMRSGRFLEGTESKKYSAPSEPLKIKNRVHPKWKEMLGNNLTRFHDDGTEVLVKRERGLIYLAKGIGEYREQVLISYRFASGKKSSYRAMINSGNGKIIYTYDRTINEDFRNRPAGLTHPLAQ